MKVKHIGYLWNVFIALLQILISYSVCEQNEQLINVLIVFENLSVCVKEERLYMAYGIWEYFNSYNIYWTVWQQYTDVFSSYSLQDITFMPTLKLHNVVIN